MVKDTIIRRDVDDSFDVFREKDLLPLTMDNPFSGGIEMKELRMKDDDAAGGANVEELGRGTEEEDDEEGEEDREATEYELSFWIVAMLKFRSKFAAMSLNQCANIRLQHLNGPWWQALSVLVALFQVICLMALALSVSFSYCAAPSECKLGQVCVEFAGDLPTCEDCLFAENILGGSTAVAGGFNPDNYHNISEYCQKTLDGELTNDDKVADFLGVTGYGTSCLYLKHNLRRAGDLDGIVRVGAFILLSCRQVSIFVESFFAR